MAKILHMADVHLGSPFESLKNPGMSALMRQSLLDNFKEAVRYGFENRADVIIIAGDLFENNFVNNAMLKEVERLFAESPETAIVITPGNHDCASGGLYNGKGFSENVHIFKSEDMERLSLEDKKLCIYGSAYTNHSKPERILRKPLRFADDGLVHIAVVHSEITDGESDYNPVSERDIRDSGVNYVAIGHTHKPTGIKRAGRVWYANPGCLFGRGFDEAGERGFIFGEITPEECMLEFIPFSKQRYEILRVDISTAEAADDVYALVQSAAAGIEDTALLRVQLAGSVPPELKIIPEIIEKQLERFYYCEVLNLTKPVKNIDDYAKQKNLTGIFTRDMLEKISADTEDEYQQDVLNAALGFGLAALAGERVAFDEN